MNIKPHNCTGRRCPAVRVATLIAEVQGMLLRNFINTSVWSVCQPKVNSFRLRVNRRTSGSDTPDEELIHKVTSTENDTNQENIACEAEMQYFMGRPSEFDGRQHNKSDSKAVPIKQTLASTNKMLFGPLIETSAQKTRCLRREALDITVKNRRKTSKKNVKESRAVVQIKPLVHYVENSHLLGIFPGNSRLSNKQNTFKVKIELQQTIVQDDPYQNTATSKYPESINKRTVALRKMPQICDLKQHKAFSQGKDKVQKIIVASWTEGREGCCAAFHNTEILLNEKSNEDDLHVTKSNEETTFKEPTQNSVHSAQKDKVKEQRLDQMPFINKLKENNNNSSFITIDNSKFSAVPSSLDMKMIKDFPLFSDTPLTGYTKLCTSVPIPTLVQENIVTVGMFDGGYQKLPSVRKILDETMPLANKIALEKWKAKMVIELGEDGFEQYRKGLLNRGMLLHSCIQSELSGQSPLIEDFPTLQGFWTSLRQILPNVSDVNVLESRLIHPYLYYQGAVDCVGSYRGTPMLIEWKTSSKPKLSLTSMFDDPLQVVAYLGALNFDSNYKLPYHVESVLVVVAYETGLPAHAHVLKKEQCEHYWKIWCSRLAQFWKQIELEETDI